MSHSSLHSTHQYYKKKKNNPSPPKSANPGCITNLTFIFFSAFAPACLPAEMNRRQSGKERTTVCGRSEQRRQALHWARPSVEKRGPKFTCSTIVWAALTRRTLDVVTHNVCFDLFLQKRTILFFCQTVFFYYFFGMIPMALSYCTSDANADTGRASCPCCAFENRHLGSSSGNRETKHTRAERRFGDNYTRYNQSHTYSGVPGS